MSDAISFAEFGEQHVELLPARTVLSMLHGAINGPTGDSGTPGANGQGMSKITFLGMFGWGGSEPSYSQGSADSGSSADGGQG